MDEEFGFEDDEDFWVLTKSPMTRSSALPGFQTLSSAASLLNPDLGRGAMSWLQEPGRMVPSEVAGTETGGGPRCPSCSRARHCQQCFCPIPAWEPLSGLESPRGH